MMPNRMPPSGRTTKPTPKVRKASSVPTTGSLLGKNSSPNTNAAAVPYRKKSYHSSAEPILAARITRKRERLSVLAVISVIVSPVLIFCHFAGSSRVLSDTSSRRRPCMARAHSQASGGAGEVGLLCRGLGFVNRSLPLGRRQRQPHRNVGHPRCNDGITGQQAAVELVEILHAHQRPGVAGGDFVEQEIARTIRGVH